MAEPQSYEPEKLTAGVTLKWKKTISDYPASEWSLVYYLRKDGVAISSFSATADGDTFETTVVATLSALFAADVYDFIGIVTKGSEKYVVFDGIVEALPNPTASAAYDPRTHARRVFDLIEAAMENRIPNGLENYTIVGRSLSKISIPDLRLLWEKYKQDVIMEEQAERLAKRALFLLRRLSKRGGLAQRLGDDLLLDSRVPARRQPVIKHGAAALIAALVPDT